MNSKRAAQCRTGRASKMAIGSQPLQNGIKSQEKLQKGNTIRGGGQVREGGRQPQETTHTLSAHSSTFIKISATNLPYLTILLTIVVRLIKLTKR